MPVCILFPEKASEICSSWSPVFRLPEVVLGVFLGMALSGRTTMWKNAGFLSVYAIASFCLLESSRLYAIPHAVLTLPLGGLVLGVLIAATAVLLFVALSWSTKIRSFRLLGNASFPLFLIHGVAIRFIYAKFGANVLAWLGYYLVCWCISIILTLVDRQLRKSPFASLKS